MKDRHWISYGLYLALAPSFVLAGARGAGAQAASTAQQGHDHGGQLETTGVRPGVKIAGVGVVSFPITTTSAEAQVWFDQGVALWHGFWDYEAIRSFKEAARLDTLSPMPYWGIVANLGGPSEERRVALAKMKARLTNASDREQYYLRAAVLNDSLPQAQKRTAFIREVEALIDKYPSDVEAKLYLARNMLSGYEVDGRPREGTIYVQSLLRDLLHTHPDHIAVHHYWVHAVEPSARPIAALTSAEKLAQLAPGVGHLVHMPGHIFFRSGMYEKARTSFLAAARVDEEYMAREKVSPKNTWNYVHNVSFLVAALAEGGRQREALQWMRTIMAIPRDSMPTGGSGGRSTFFVHYRFGTWEAAQKDPNTFAPLDTSEAPGRKALRAAMVAYANGMAAIERGKLDDATRQADILDAESGRLTAAGQTPSPLLAVFSLDLRGNLHSRKGEHPKAYELLALGAKAEKAIGYAEPPPIARPVLESLGEAYLRGKGWDKAKQAFEGVLEARPNSGFALYGIARSLEGAGKADEALTVYRKFLAEWANADRDLPSVMHATRYVAKGGASSGR